MRKHTHLRIGKYDQHSTDQLNTELTPLEFMASSFPEVKGDIEMWRGKVGRFGVTGEMQTNPIK